MAAEANTGERTPHTDERRSTGRTNKSPRKVRPAGGKIRGAEQASKSGKPEDEQEVRSSVLHGKVKALKEKQIKERRNESVHSDCCSGEGEVFEDALVTPQLRTYLTEELLDCSKQASSSAQPEIWGSDEFWGTSNLNGSSISNCSGCKIENFSNFIANNENNTQFWSRDRLYSSSDESPCAPQNARMDPALGLSLAERVERNRQELRCKFNQGAYYSADAVYGDVTCQGQDMKDGSWLCPGDIDGDSGVSIPVTEDCRELSVRHEQAKQLLHRARMKAKGASPLRASHCVLPHPNSQPPVCRGASVPGALTDGGSQSDSSNSDYCSWHRGSRGCSPSHVRFQDESEWDVEERYRERKQVPLTTSVTTTPPSRRQSNSPVSWAEQRSSYGNGQCGTCGSYVKGSGTSQAAMHGTNLRNVHLGSKITQDGSLSTPLGGKPSPHWILPSQPWRVHTELIRETHIGGDSTADSSGEEEGSRSHSKKNSSWATHKNCTNSTPNEVLGHGTILYPLNASNSEQDIDMKNGTTSSALETQLKSNLPVLESGSTAKVSEPNLQTGIVSRGYHVDSIRTGLQKMPQDLETRPGRKPRNSSVEFGKRSNALNTELGICNIVLNLDSRQGTYIVDQAVSRTQTSPMVQCKSHMVSQSDCGPTPCSFSTSRHVPIPPSGKAPNVVTPRNGRLKIRSEGIKQQLCNVQGGDVIQTSQDRKGIQSDPVPKSKRLNQEGLGDLDNYQLSTSSMRPKEPKAGEPSEGRKTKEVKEGRTSVKQQVTREQRDGESSHTSSRHRITRHQSATEHRDSGVTHSHSREQAASEMRYPKMEEKCTEKPRTNGQLHNNNADTGSGNNTLICQTASPVSSVMDRSLEAPLERSWQPEVKKGDIRSGMRKIFDSIGLTSRHKLSRFQSSSLEQIPPLGLHEGNALANRDNDSSDGSVKPGKIKKSPSLQSLKLMSPFHLPRKASSVQNLLGKSDRSAVYVTGNAPRRVLSVEDIGSPGMARAVGKVAEVYPDGTRLLELKCPEKGGFGFTISSGNGRPDSGIYVQEMSDANTAKLYSGLLYVGDEILEVNGAKVSTLGLSRTTEIMHREPSLSLRVLHQRRTKC
ncbi:uncharacterized protein KIAA1614 homolog [Pseudophryne corroboree]|uniref:uncharacterized protein KIAA1614 homolog n=1 Tax=Pseudophryne corroboree TaxID=495146 RepID=UPI0030813FDF